MAAAPYEVAFDVEREIAIAQVPEPALKPSELPTELRQAIDLKWLPRLRAQAVSASG